MRAIVLGGAGDMGSRTVRTLAAYPEVEQLTVADINLGRAEVLVRSLGGEPRLRAVRVNADDPRHLSEVMAGHDVAASAIGPFYKYERKVAQAALVAGVDYVSICDDYDAAQAVLELDEEAQARGRRILTGLGWTPGLSNLLARRGADALDLTERIHIAWTGASADSKGYAVVLHTIHILTGLVPSYQQGRQITVPAGSGKVRVQFPKPLGAVTCFHVGHPEPVTIPRFIPGVQEVTLRGGLTEPFLNWLGLTIARLGLTNSVAKKDAIGTLIKKLLPTLEKIGPAGVPCSGLRVDVHGTKDGAPRHLVYTAADHMENLTGIPLAIGALFMGRGEVGPVGVLAPEARGALDVGRFLTELQRHGVQVTETELDAGAESA